MHNVSTTETDNTDPFYTTEPPKGLIMQDPAIYYFSGAHFKIITTTKLPHCKQNTLYIVFLGATSNQYQSAC